MKDSKKLLLSTCIAAPIMLMVGCMPNQSTYNPRYHTTSTYVATSYGNNGLYQNIGFWPMWGTGFYGGTYYGNRGYYRTGYHGYRHGGWHGGGWRGGMHGGGWRGGMHGGMHGGGFHGGHGHR